MNYKFLCVFLSAFYFIDVYGYPTHKRCQSETRCFYNTPLSWFQGHPDLDNYVGNQIKVEGYSDQGLCVPTAGAILLKAVLSEKDPQTKLKNSFLETYDNRPWYENVYLLGMEAKTNFNHGGTWVTALYFAYKRYFKDTIAKESLILAQEGKYFGYSNMTNKDLIDGIKYNKKAYLIGVDERIKKQKKISGINLTWYEGNSGHALMIKGFDGDRLHIHDPWGYQYFARVTREYFKRNQFGVGNTQSVFSAISKGDGWMPSLYNNPNYKLVLKELISLSLD